MTELPPPPPAPPHRRSRRRPIALGIVALLVVGAATAAGVWWLQRGPDYPDQWDAKVKPYVDYVEKERGLKFEHPVYVDFLTDAEFDKQVTSTDGDLDENDREEVRRFEGMLRALGLLPAGVDLLDAVNELSRGSVIGLYDDEDERIRMRGTTLTPPVRSTLVHEPDPRPAGPALRPRGGRRGAGEGRRHRGRVGLAGGSSRATRTGSRRRGPRACPRPSASR
ncbi:hypothetical protein G5V59_25040 [Nocardioides sp. W3-2-3]|uniref:hypothetical protein n=1 Tax=Nocardioides convexus TaxID=2712224 RepID=UPI0024186AEF|nr:hypothetical protein [Nocardioides convexus]NHA01827.1 hypothetical protein [Nocardioides convexus]